MSNRKAKYEKEKRGAVVLRVQLSSTDDPELWEKVKKGLVDKYGNAKKGILELAKKDGIID